MPEKPFDPSTASLDEIRALFRELPGPDLEAGTQAAARDAQLTKPRGALGRLEELAAWLATWQGRHPPRLQHPRTAVFAGNHGVAALGVSAYPAEVTAQMVQNFVAGGAAVNQLCRDLRFRPPGLRAGARAADRRFHPGSGDGGRGLRPRHGLRHDGGRAEPRRPLPRRDGHRQHRPRLRRCACALFGGEAEDWVGRGTGVAGKALETKIRVVREGVARHRGAGDPLDLLAALGGLELAAIAGAVMAARLARTPVVLDGFACTAAAAVLWKIDPKSLEHCIVGHRSVEPGHSRLLEAIGKEPLFDFGMRLGEGSGATLALGVLRAAVECHAGMATFADAGVSGPA